MKILSASQIREADAYTIAHEPISSINLMERASRAFVTQFLKIYSKTSLNTSIKVFCGLGNNGGDGLAIARMLHQEGFNIESFIVEYSNNSTPDFKINFERLKAQADVRFIKNNSDFPLLYENDIVIDAILGVGLSRNLNGIVAEIVQKINSIGCEVVSVDIPTGLFADQPNENDSVVINATHTISFQLPKLAFMLPQNADYVENWHIVDIGLSKDFIQKTDSKYHFSTSDIEQKIKIRRKFSHKGTYGNALLIAGSKGMIGAAVLSARACMRTGTGKMTVHLPKCGYEIMQISVPEVMVNEDDDPNYITETWQQHKLQSFNAIGIGCGMSVSDKITTSIGSLLDASFGIPMVIDADGINALSTEKDRSLISKIPKNSILTPHPKEFQKLVNQTWVDDFEKLNILQKFCIEHQIIICLKGSHTAICLSDGSIYFNSTGNPYMATAGSGDVLTGIILSLLAQGYDSNIAAILGVYLHGKAGDLASLKRHNSTILASDIIENIQL